MLTAYYLSISLALIGEIAHNLWVIEYLYEACPLSRPGDLSVSLSYAYYIYSIHPRMFGHSFFFE